MKEDKIFIMQYEKNRDLRDMLFLFNSALFSLYKSLKLNKILEKNQTRLRYIIMVMK
jgi:hypothetical protein